MCFPKVDVSMAKKNYKFADGNNLPLYFVSASDGSNVVKVGVSSRFKIILYN